MCGTERMINMAYNNYFPTTYQPYYPQQQQQYVQPAPQAQMPALNQQAQTNNSIIWVQGEAGAKSYLVAPNTTVQLWDSENQVIYLKSADASGMPSMKVLDYKIREAVQPTQQAQAVAAKAPSVDYVTREELIAFESQIREQIANLTPVKFRTKREEKTDE